MLLFPVYYEEQDYRKEASSLVRPRASLSRSFVGRLTLPRPTPYGRGLGTFRGFHARSIMGCREVQFLTWSDGQTE